MGKILFLMERIKDSRQKVADINSRLKIFISEIKKEIEWAVKSFNQSNASKYKIGGFILEPVDNEILVKVNLLLNPTNPREYIIIDNREAKCITDGLGKCLNKLGSFNFKITIAHCFLIDE